MIQETYCSFEQAEALNELGISTFGDCFYSINHTLNSYHSDEWDGKILFDAPTLSIAQKWLMEEKGLDILPIRDDNHGHYLPGYILLIVGNFYGRRNIAFRGNTYTKYDDCLSAGIDKCIELLKEES